MTNCLWLCSVGSSAPSTCSFALQRNHEWIAFDRFPAMEVGIKLSWFNSAQASQILGPNFPSTRLALIAARWLLRSARTPLHMHGGRSLMKSFRLLCEILQSFQFTSGPTIPRQSSHIANITMWVVRFLTALSSVGIMRRLEPMQMRESRDPLIRNTYPWIYISKPFRAITTLKVTECVKN